MQKIKSTTLAVMIVMALGVIFCGTAIAQQEFFEKGLSTPVGPKFVPDEIIVKFKPGVSANIVGEINRKHGTSVLSTSRFAGFKRLKVPRGRTVEQMVATYKKNPNVEYAEANFIAHAFEAPNDPLYIYQWHLDIPEGEEVSDWHGENGGGINVEPAWDMSTGLGVTVAVIDTGVAYENYINFAQAPDLENTLFVAGHDFVNDDTHPNDDNGHGTHVTGTIAQSTNNIGVAGVAFDCSIMPVKVLDRKGSGTYADIADGIYFAADNGADVINMSLGGSAGSPTLEAALAHAYGAGVTIVCASGNDGSADTVSYPAAYDAYCIAVGATRYDETVTWYSNGGDSLDLTAPGGDLNMDQNGDGYGDGVLQQTFGVNSTDWGYWFYQGTSMAAPHVAGVAALVIANGVVGPDNVREALQNTAEDKTPADWTPAYGWGIVDAAAALGYSAVSNTQPVADAGGSYTGTEDVAITFNGSASDDDDGDTLTYAWDFDDGSTGSGVNPTHTYTAGGTYDVTLVVNDGTVNSEASTTTATIEEVNDPPVADAGPDQTALIGDVVTFDGSGSYDIDEGDTLTYAWDFGDDLTGVGVSPTHTYTAGGTYTVTLVVNDGTVNSEASTTTATITAVTLSNELHVANIVMDLKTAGINTSALATVTIYDASNNPVVGATVSGYWEDATSDADSGITDANGQVTVGSDRVKRAPGGTTFTFTVDNVVLTDWTYESTDNVETSDSITVD